MTNPQRIRINNRRTNQAKWRSHKIWKDLVKEHAHTPEAVCEHCLKHHGELKKSGKPVYLTINHTSRSLYATEELYTTWNPQYMEICCTTCNWMYEKGKKSCPVCHNQYIHTLEPDNMCQGCWDKKHPIEAQKRMVDVRKRARERKAIKAALIQREKDKVKKWKEDHKK